MTKQESKGSEGNWAGQEPSTLLAETPIQLTPRRNPMRTLIYGPEARKQFFTSPEKIVMYHYNPIGWFESDTSQEWKHESDSKTLIRTAGGMWLARLGGDEFQGHYPMTDVEVVVTLLSWGYHELVAAHFPDEALFPQVKDK